MPYGFQWAPRGSTGLNAVPTAALAAVGAAFGRCGLTTQIYVIIFLILKIAKPLVKQAKTQTTYMFREISSATSTGKVYDNNVSSDGATVSHLMLKHSKP